MISTDLVLYTYSTHFKSSINVQFFAIQLRQELKISSLKLSIESRVLHNDLCARTCGPVHFALDDHVTNVSTASAS